MSHDGKGLSALYARDTSSNNEGDDSGRKRSRFDEGEFGRDSREDRTRDSRRGDSKRVSNERTERLSNELTERIYSERVEREPRGDRSERSDRGQRDSVERRDSRDSREHMDNRDSRYGRDNRDKEYGDRDRDYKRHRDERSFESRGRDQVERERDRDRSRDYNRTDYRDTRDTRDSRDYRGHRDTRRTGNVEIPFDQFLRLSPWRGPVTPLEERPRHLKNWDAAPSGFERISADKAKLTGLFPPPGNIAKSSNYVPPTLDPARAAMFQLLNKDNNALPSSTSSDNSAANLPANLLKQARRFYVGNLPLDCSESTLMNFLETNLRGLSGTSQVGVKDDSRVLSINVSTDRSYAFVECRVAEDASLAMNLDGVIFEGSQLKIRRPKEYHLAMTSGLLNNNNSSSSGSSGSALVNNGSIATNSTVNPIDANSQIPKRQLIISNIPDILTGDHVKSLLSLVTDVRYFLLLKDRENDKSLGVAVFEFVEDLEGEEWSGPFLKHSGGSVFMGPFEMKFSRVFDILNAEDNADFVYLRTLLSVYNLQPGYATAPTSTPILQLLNIVTRDTLQADYDAIYEDIRSELGKLSADLELVIPKPDESVPVPGVGKVFVKFGTVEMAAKAASELAGRIFDGHTCIVSFFPIEKYEKRLF